MNCDLQAINLEINDISLKTGKRVSFLRNELKLTQSELALKSGVSTQTISRIELGEQMLKWDTACRLAMALNATLDYLAFGSSSPARLIDMIDKFNSFEKPEYLFSDEAKALVAETKKRFV